jgi:hypothetical protein
MKLRNAHANQVNQSANALLYAFYLMALHPEVQEKLYAEVQNVCGDRVPQLEDMSNLIYALCIMYETMRLFPVLGTVANRTEKDEILLGKHLILKNTSIGPDMVSLHRNEKYWGPTCNQFNPSRLDNREKSSDEGWFTMVDEKIKVPVKGAFWPFGEGPRVCLGMAFLDESNMVGKRFAEIEFVICMAMVVKKWTIHFEDDWTEQMVWRVLDASVQFTTIRPSSNIPLVFKRREQKF